MSAAWGPFGLDAAASEFNSKCERCLTEDDNALVLPWSDWGRVWLNPPYQDLLAWVTKATEESDKGLTVVLLLPWGQWAEWMELTIKRAELVRIVGRIKFIDPEAANRTQPMGMNILAVFRPPIEGLTWPTGFTGASIRA